MKSFTLTLLIICCSFSMFLLGQEHFSSKEQPTPFINHLLQHQLSQNPIWKNFQKEYGNHYVLWNPITGTPHRVFGKPIHIEGFTNINENNVEAAARTFLDTHRSLLKTQQEQLGLQKAMKINGTWYVSFLQLFEGREVLNSEIELRLSSKGEVIAFGVDVFEIEPLETTPTLDSDVIHTIALEYLINLGLHEVDIEIAEHVQIYGGIENHLIYILTARSLHPPTYRQILIDAHSGEIVQDYDRLCQVHGTVSGMVRPDLPTDTPEPRHFFNQNLTINGVQMTTDQLGNFMETLTEPALLTAQLQGPYVHVDRFNLPDATISMTVAPEDTVLIEWTDDNSAMSERNVFYYTNVAYDFTQNIDPEFTQLDYPLTCFVDDGNSGSCNAFWNGVNIHYNVEAAGCINSAHSPATIYHEYGHAINDHVYQQAGVAQGMLNKATHEALADVTCMMIENENKFARGFFGIGTSTRDFNNNNRFPDNVTGQEHTDGLIIAGAFWDLKEATSIEVASRLAHFAKYGTPDDMSLGVAFAEWFIEVLIADDDDGDLSNGTPNFEAIQEAFCGHGIGTNLFVGVQLDFDEQANIVPTGEEIPVTFTHQALPFFVNLENAFTLHYSTNYFQNIQTVPVIALGNAQFEAIIPAQPEGTIVKYYISLNGTECEGTQKVPFGDIENEHFSLLVGKYKSMFFDDFEINNGWTVGDISDNATSGIWQRAAPQLTLNPFPLQPATDHSINGTRCFVTGALAGVNWWDFDVDGGKTTLYSPTLDLTGYAHPAVQYYKWFSNDTGPNSGQDPWLVQINMGQGWTNIENTFYANRKWNKVQLLLEDFTNLGDQVQFRFIANDLAPGSIIEALIDDFELLGIELETNTTNPNLTPTLSVTPNPFSEAVQFSYFLPTPSNTQLRIFNALGEEVWSVLAKNVDFGTRIVTWNGQSKNGIRLPAGVYFYESWVGKDWKSGKLVLR